MYLSLQQCIFAISWNTNDKSVDDDNGDDDDDDDDSKADNKSIYTLPNLWRSATAVLYKI